MSSNLYFNRKRGKNQFNSLTNSNNKLSSVYAAEINPKGLGAVTRIPSLYTPKRDPYIGYGLIILLFVKSLLSAYCTMNILAKEKLISVLTFIIIARTSCNSYAKRIVIQKMMTTC